MRGIVTLLLLFVLLVAHLDAQEKSDVIVMKNGDRITCEIVSLGDNVLYVKLDYADGTISLQWSKVARLESSRRFRLKTAKGLVYMGTIRTVDGSSDRPVKIEIAKDPQEKVELPSSDIVTLAATSDEFLKRFNGDISLGLSYAKGDSSTQYNLNSGVEYPRERWRAVAQLTSNLTSTSGSRSSSRNQLTLRMDRLLRWNNYFYTGVFNALQSTEQGIQLRSNISGGIGYYFRNTGRFKASVVGGLFWQRTAYTEASTHIQRQKGAMILTDIRYTRFKKTTIDLEAAFMPSISQPGRFYFDVRQSYYVKLFSNLSWNISSYGNWDNRPPPGLSGSDFGMSTGLGWSFGNR
ncbi:MAG TPA: DUF481 domain-containing protein [Pyrinomonadaceae bacterium]|jgi:hypothetical protein|nr:DUF481 domain-containing protein [Pyrinomonadaceae bacterium]